MRVRVLLSAALSPLIIGYAAVATVLALIVSTAQRANFSAAGMLLAAAPGWLAAQHVPLGLGKYSLGVLPLLPTVLSFLLIAKVSASAAGRIHASGAQARQVIFVIAGAHAVFGGALALLLTSDSVTATPAVAFFGCGVMAGCAATIGTAKRSGLFELLTSKTSQLTLRGLRAGVLGVAALCACGAILLAIGLIISWTSLTQIFASGGHGIGDQLGLFLLSIGYLPNAIIAAISFGMGPGLTMGAFAISPVHVSVSKLPAAPLFAAVPTTQSKLLLLAALLPLLTGLLVGWYCRRTAPAPLHRVRAVAVAAAVVGGSCFLLAALASGRFGNGVFSPITVPAGLVGAVAFGWTFLPGSLVVLIFGGKAKLEATITEPDEPVIAAASVETGLVEELEVESEDSEEIVAIEQDFIDEDFEEPEGIEESEILEEAIEPDEDEDHEDWGEGRVEDQDTPIDRETETDQAEFDDVDFDAEIDSIDHLLVDFDEHDDEPNRQDRQPD